ncbi:MAG: DivIVA domain-containing protein [Actinomyces sp.]|jgi:DivIVA domain-containing protein|uniref:DivIVA domain-containing protein n=1 Tax=Schaalia naturae TaxID=635203 RepID=A0ABW2SKI9_9ACTO|nr:DivIVA domain-containing protein [Actinomyces sp.]MCI1641919.1 DivIVA domain-containing protein [Actinomyces sp.]MCI1661932.1 DivIVA domain-containing protein [Actinomyces sp.]MCI1691189.1 DivIVA domain-containing protein [Actinomyces sp.]MCI1787735.1 DivIVA domain-containing protein [Actinomyces sp.]MCI1830358.1 DivIVA domain-containing protein [Actinomyces sp.]
MNDAFPGVSFFRKGYDPDLVDQFFEEARRAYEGGVPAERFSAEQVRQATFPLKRHGYRIDAVDAAMNRLEAAFVQRDRADHIAVNGESAWYERVADRATTLYPRLLRPRGERFAHPERGRGYDAEPVDDLLDRLADYFDDRAEITADEIRHAVFPARKGSRAYAEGAVDAYLGRAVEILLAVS